MQCMKLDQQDLEKIADLTPEHYNRRAEEFWEGTGDHDVSQNIAAMLGFIESEPPFTILDFGCGPGRDLKAFAERGHIAVGLEGAAHFAAMARTHSGCEVWQQDFLKLDLPRDRFDGVFANAALFHVPGQELPRVLRELHASDLDSNEAVKFFIKLPSWFKIDTPIGSYNPDWAFVTEREEKLYFARETKGTLDSEECRTKENQKIACGRRHFETIGINFDVVTSLAEVLI
jgi:SAM-dependent methyltransferase